jgi:hypothetical protein
LLLWFESNDSHRHRRVTLLLMGCAHVLMACGQLFTGIALRATPDIEWRRYAPESQDESRR